MIRVDTDNGRACLHIRLAPRDVGRDSAPPPSPPPSPAHPPVLRDTAIRINNGVRGRGPGSGAGGGERGQGGPPDASTPRVGRPPPPPTGLNSTMRLLCNYAGLASRSAKEALCTMAWPCWHRVAYLLWHAL